MENREFPERLVSVSSTIVKSGKNWTVSFRRSNKELSRCSPWVGGSASTPARWLLISRAAPGFLVCEMGTGWRGSAVCVTPSRCPEEGAGRKVSSALSLTGMGSGGERSQRQPLLGAWKSSGPAHRKWGQRGERQTVIWNRLQTSVPYTMLEKRDTFFPGTF